MLDYIKDFAQQKEPLTEEKGTYGMEENTCKSCI